MSDMGKLHLSKADRGGRQLWADQRNETLSLRSVGILVEFKEPHTFLAN